MATRTVEIRIVVNDIDAIRKLDELSARLDKLKAKFDDLSKKVISPDIKTDSITKANAELDKFKRNLDEVSRKRVTAHVGVDVNSGRGRTALDRTIADSNRAIANMLDGGGNGSRHSILRSIASGAKNSIRTAGWRALLNFFTGGNGGPPEIPGGAAQGAGGAFSWGQLAGSPLGIASIVGLAGPAAALVDALAGTGIGGAGALGAFSLANKFNPAMLKPGMSNIDKSLSTVAQSISPTIGMMLVQLGKFVANNKGSIAKLFASALPFLQQFINLAGPLAKYLLPAMTGAMKQMVQSGALTEMTQGFVFLIQGVAGFIKAIGPGFRAGAMTFRAISMGIRDALYFLGAAFGQLGKAAGVAYHDIHQWWDELRHNTAVDFDAIRHFIASVWDDIWHNTVDRVSNGVQDVMNFDAKLRHGIANDYDLIRHYLATEWDQIWQNTTHAVSTGVTDVVNFFKKLPGEILGALKTLGTGLYNLGKAALTDMWSGLKAVGGSILGWLKSFITSFPSAIMKFLHMSPPHPGSAFFDLGANIMHHFEAGLKSRAASVSRAIHGTMSGPAGGAPSAAARYARALASRYGWGGQWGSINAVAMRESGWSMTARNPSSGAYGIAQFINGPSEYYQYGGNPNTIAGQVTAFFNYIHQRYGNPNAAWAHELNYGWYDKGGILKKGLTLALNTTGQDEYITRSPGGGGGDVYNIYPPESATNPDAYALTMIQAIRKYKMRHGNAVVGIA